MERVRSFADDGRVLLFQSDRTTGGFGQSDIWAISRKHVNDDFGWSEPVNLGPVINTTATELASSYLFADGGRVKKLFFSSSKPGGFGGPDIYESTISDLGQFDWANGRMRLTSVHAGVTVELVQKKTGFTLEIAPDVYETPPPPADELRLLREVIDPLGVRKLETLGGGARKELLRDILAAEGAL